MASDTLSTLIDVRNRMLADVSEEARAAAAEQLGAMFTKGEMAGPEHEVALTIFRKLAQDVTAQVRKALAIQIASSPLIPVDLARTIAADVNEIAIPFINASPALDDDHLLNIIASGDDARRIAIAARELVNEGVSDALVQTGNGDVVKTLLKNPGAAVSEPSLHEIMDRFAADNMVQVLMVDRPSLPLGVTERLAEVVSGVLRDRLIKQHSVSPELAAAMSGLARERALIADLSLLTNDYDVEMLVARLNGKGRLTPTLLMRTLIKGNLRFFEMGMAVLAGIPPDNAAQLVKDRGPLGFKALYEKNGLPPTYFRAFRAAIDGQVTLPETATPGQRRVAANTVLSRVQGEHGDKGPIDLESFLSRMIRASREAA